MIGNFIQGLIVLAFISPAALAQNTEQQDTGQATGSQMDTGSGAVSGEAKTGTIDTTRANASVGDDTSRPAKSTKTKRMKLKKQGTQGDEQ